MKIAIIGDSGHAGDVADIAIDNGYQEIIFLGRENKKENFCGFRVMKDDMEVVGCLAGKGFQFAIGIGDSNVRNAIYERYPNLSYPTIIHSKASLGNIQKNSWRHNKGIIIAAGARITNNVSIGSFGFIGVNAVVGHDCVLDDFVSLMPSSVISGNVHIKNGSYIGCNASIRQGISECMLSVGPNAIVGMGAVVLDDVPENSQAVGVPAVSQEK